VDNRPILVFVSCLVSGRAQVSPAALVNTSTVPDAKPWFAGIALFTYHKYRKMIDSPVPLDAHGRPIIDEEDRGIALENGYNLAPERAPLVEDDDVLSLHAVSLSTFTLRRWILHRIAFPGRASGRRASAVLC
jgi:hypothetical protein